MANIVERGWVYRDEFSREESTGDVKVKYKLANTVIADELAIFPFIVLTSRGSSCKRWTTKIVEPKEWCDVQTRHFPKTTTYIDVKRVEILSVEDIQKKRRGGRESFAKMARLPENGMRELDQLKVRARRSTDTPDDTKTILGITLGEEITDSFLHKYNL